MATQVPGRHRKWQRDESNASQSHSGGAFTDAFTLDAKPLQEGDYKISAGFELRLVTPGASTLAKAELLVNGSLKSSSCYNLEEWSRHTGWDFQSFTDGATPTIKIRFKRENSGGTAEIRKMKISIERKKG